MSTELEPITDAALDWQVIQQQASLLAKSNLVPKQFRGRADDIVVASLMARELGLGPIAALTYIDVIEGSPTVNAEGKVALVRQRGHSITGTADGNRAIAVGKRADNGDELEVVWSIEMAQRAGLANKQVWKQYPEAMLWSRAVSQLCRMLFSDVLMGMSYTSEEVEAFSGIETTVPPDVDTETGEVLPLTVKRPSPVAAIESGGGNPGATPLAAEGGAGSIPDTATPASSPKNPQRPSLLDHDRKEVDPRKPSKAAQSMIASLRKEAEALGIDDATLNSIVEEAAGVRTVDELTTTQHGPRIFQELAKFTQ